MAIIFGEIDCLKNLIDNLKKGGINHIKYLDDVFTFKKICDDKVKEAEDVARHDHHVNLDRQKEMITKHVAERTIDRGNESYLRNFFQSLVSRFILFNLRRELNRLERESEEIIHKNISQIYLDKSRFAFTTHD